MMPYVSQRPGLRSDQFDEATLLQTTLHIHTQTKLQRGTGTIQVLSALGINQKTEFTCTSFETFLSITNLETNQISFPCIQGVLIKMLLKSTFASILDMVGFTQNVTGSTDCCGHTHDLILTLGVNVDNTAIFHNLITNELCLNHSVNTSSPLSYQSYNNICHSSQFYRKPLT